MEFAKLFAKKGNNVILVARNESRLQTIAKELSLNKVDVKIYAKDLSIVNNAGVGINEKLDINIYL